MGSFRPRQVERSARRAGTGRRRRTIALTATLIVASAVALSLWVGNSAGPGLAPFPGSSDGVASAGGVEVAGAQIALGRVPLDTTVVPTWTLRNTSGEPVSLGRPHAEIVDGCCPGDLALGEQTLAAGDATTLKFPLRMHAGMDGPHDFIVHVPVDRDVLALRVTGDFSN